MPQNQNILIIGDEPSLAEQVRLLTASSPMEVYLAADCRAALDEARRHAIDLVVLDRLTCAARGGQGAADVAALCPDALFLLINEGGSAHGTETSGGAEAAGTRDGELPFRLHGFLRKPYRAEEIETAVRNALEYNRLVHAHKRSEIALLESEGRLANMGANALVGIAIVQNNRVVYQNPAQQAIFRDLHAPFSLEDFSCVNPHDLKKVKEVYEGLLKKKIRTADFSFRLVMPDRENGKPVAKSVQCRASAYRHKGEEAILVNMMDVTHARELEDLVMIKDKMTSLGRVAAGIAHEIRNPLTGINSYLFTLEDLASGDSLAPEGLELIRRITSQIQVASNKIETVIKRVLDFSKPSKPKMAMIRINDALEEAIGLSAVAVRKKGIAIEKDLQGSLPLCYGDTHLMEQVALNLINNAAVAVERGGADKRIRVASYAAKNRVCVSVSDSGPGIPEDMADKIFDPFFTTRSDGSGIGLSIAQRIVVDHGGTITVGRSEWDGAEFVVDLPVEKRMYPR